MQGSECTFCCFFLSWMYFQHQNNLPQLQYIIFNFLQLNLQCSASLLSLINIINYNSGKFKMQKLKYACSAI